MLHPVVTRNATVKDLDAIAGVFSPSIRLLEFLPSLHTVEEDRWFIEHVLFKECDITVAELKGEIISFLARTGTEIRLLHTHPDHIGKGAGGTLLHEAQADGEGRLELWCFQENLAARRFYERHGFRATCFTDGARNEEKTPDVRYVWTA